MRNSVEGLDVKVFLSEIYDRPMSVREMADAIFFKPSEVRKIWALCYRSGLTNNPSAKTIRWTAGRSDNLFIWLQTDISYREAMELDYDGLRRAAVSYLERLGNISYLSEYIET